MGVREGLNLIHILGDSEKQNEARLLAASLTGAASVTPLADIVAFLLWEYGHLQNLWRM